MSVAPAFFEPKMYNFVSEYSSEYYKGRRFLSTIWIHSCVDCCRNIHSISSSVIGKSNVSLGLALFKSLKLIKHS